MLSFRFLVSERSLKWKERNMAIESALYAISR